MFCEITKFNPLYKAESKPTIQPHVHLHILIRGLHFHCFTTSKIFIHTTKFSYTHTQSHPWSRRCSPNKWICGYPFRETRPGMA